VSGSPVLYRDHVIVAMTGKKGTTLTALDKATGKPSWTSTEVFTNSAGSSPVIRTIGGVAGVLYVANDRVAFLDPEQGIPLWEFTGWKCGGSPPTPTVLPDGNRVFITGGSNAGSVMIEILKSENRFSVRELWRIADGAAGQPAIFYDGRLYGDLEGTGGFSAIDPANGKIVFAVSPTTAAGHGAVLLAVNKLFMLDGKTGSLSMTELTREGFRLLSSSTMATAETGHETAPLALSDGLLLLRDGAKIKCVDVWDHVPLQSDGPQSPFAAAMKQLEAIHGPQCTCPRHKKPAIPTDFFNSGR
jgi:DNA-binding beta-propeller fold protein YncE